MRRFETAEVNGFVFAYHGRTGDEPTWQVPDFSGGPSFRAAKRLRFPGHPQTTSENSVDRAHLGHIHGYRQLEQTAPTTVEGPVLSSAYSFTREMLAFGFRRFDLALEIVIGVWGLGVSTVEIRSKSGMLVPQWVLATPVDGELIDMWLVMDLKRLPKWPWLSGPLAWVANRVAPRLLVRELELEVLKDAEIWARQSYRPSPAFSAADRDILRFRRYCEQFYAQPPSG